MEIVIAVVTVVPATIAAIAAWKATVRNEKQLTTSNGTTTAAYTQQTYDLLQSVAHRQNEIADRVGAHINDEVIHNASIS